MRNISGHDVLAYLHGDRELAALVGPEVAAQILDVLAPAVQPPATVAQRYPFGATCLLQDTGDAGLPVSAHHRRNAAHPGSDPRLPVRHRCHTHVAECIAAHPGAVELRDGDVHVLRVGHRVGRGACLHPEGRGEQWIAEVERDCIERARLGGPGGHYIAVLDAGAQAGWPVRLASPGPHIHTEVREVGDHTVGADGRRLPVGIAAATQRPDVHAEIGGVRFGDQGATGAGRRDPQDIRELAELREQPDILGSDAAGEEHGPVASPLLDPDQVVSIVRLHPERRTCPRHPALAEQRDQSARQVQAPTREVLGLLDLDVQRLAASLRQCDEVVEQHQSLTVGLAQGGQLIPREIIDPPTGVVDAVEVAHALGELGPAGDIGNAAEIDVMAHHQAAVLAHHQVALEHVGGHVAGHLVGERATFRGVDGSPTVTNDEHSGPGTTLQRRGDGDGQTHREQAAQTCCRASTHPMPHLHVTTLP